MPSISRPVKFLLVFGLAVTAVFAVAQEQMTAAPAEPAAQALQFVPVPPCRVVDTRNQNGTFGGPPIQGGTARSFPIAQGSCRIPLGATAFSLNVTVVPPGPLGYLTVWPTGQSQPLTSTLNSPDGRIKANAAIVAAGNGGGAVSVFASNTTNVIVDINGYFVTQSTASLAFYSLSPCRLADTRQPGGGGPIPGGTTRDFPILGIPGCSVPSTAVAYSLNFTAVPPGPLGYLTAWPMGGARPNVSTLNDLTGTIVANAAIVGAGVGTGEISVYPSSTTHLVIDIDGYFAPPGTGGLAFYAVTPCRVIDTRSGGGQPFSGTLVPPVDVEHSACAPSAQAQAYVLNATVVPHGALGYLTLWPDGEPQPGSSTLK